MDAAVAFRMALTSSPAYLSIAVSSDADGLIIRHPVFEASLECGSVHLFEIISVA
jgi:hypothetical protein